MTYSTRRLLVLGWFGLAACNTVPNELIQRAAGQTEYASAAPNGQAPPGSGGAKSSNMADSAGGGTSGGGGAESASPRAPGAADTTSTSGTTQPRNVEETDLYRLDGNRLYYLNAYRGLMVFDVTNPDAPQFLGRSPIVGSPVEMVVRDGFAHVVVADWFGKMADGTPFYGSIVRSIDARDPAHPVVTGEAKLGGFVRDLRVVGDVLYAVSEDYGYSYGFINDDTGESVVMSNVYQPTVQVSSVSFAGGSPTLVSQKSYPGYQGIFFVSQNAILLAHDKRDSSTNGYYYVSGQGQIDYLDISDAGGTIVEKGSIDVVGNVPWSGSDGGRFNIDFSDGRYAKIVTCRGDYCGSGAGYRVSVADFQDPANPTLAGFKDIPSSGWNVVARFMGDRLYISPGSNYYGDNDGTPVQVFDLSDPAHPAKKGETTVDGAVWSLLPGAEGRLFALGTDYNAAAGAPITLSLIDVSDSANPHVIGDSQFGSGWAWTPAAGTFKAFTLDLDQHLVVLPFSGWGYESNAYNNGLQLIEFSDTTLTTRGTANTKGWVERGIFVGNRLVSLSNQSLAVIDYTDRESPAIVTEIELARNVIDTQPAGEDLLLTIGDFWDYDQDKSRLRIVAPGEVDELTNIDAKKAETELAGYNPRIFYNGRYAYAVTTVRRAVSCESLQGKRYNWGYYGNNTCFIWNELVQVIDLQDGLKKLGHIEMPARSYGYYGYFYGCYPYDWYGGDDIVQVQGDALVFRRWETIYSVDGKIDEWQNRMHLIDLKDPNAPTIASTAIIDDATAWWGNLRAVGDQVYATHWEWFSKKSMFGGEKWYVKYYLDHIDLADRSHPKVKTKINVPGMLVGGAGESLFFVDYRWYDNYEPWSAFAIAKLQGDKAVLQAWKPFDGYVGNVLTRGSKAYTTIEHYDRSGQYWRPYRALLEIDATDPKNPTLKSSEQKRGWGWLLDVEGDRALMTSGWSGRNIDIYKLSSEAPKFDQTLQIRSWWPSSASRLGDDLFISTGYYGVEKLHLE